MPIPCPACKKIALKPLKDPGSGLELDTCPECAGLWFDGGELRRLYNSPELASHLLSALGTGSGDVAFELSSPVRACPRCRKRMEPTQLSEVTVDLCPLCEGVWFDSGELQKVTKIFKTRGLKGDARVVEEIREGLKRAGTGHDAFVATVVKYLRSLVTKK